MQTDYQQTFIERRAKIVLEVGNQIIFVVVVSVIYLIGNLFFCFGNLVRDFLKLILNFSHVL